MIALLLTALTGFLLGSFPTGFLVAKTKGIDIRQHGSGNIGATNVLRVLGKKLGYFVFAVDALKGVAAVLVAGVLATKMGTSPDLGKIFAGLSCILGHNFTPWLGFKGGKGVATSAGVLLALLPLIMGLVLAVWLLVFYTSRFVSVASIAAGLALPLLTWLIVVHPQPERVPLLWFALLVGGLIVLRHKSNIRKLLDGTEARFEKKKKP